MKFSDIKIGNKYYLIYGETDQHGSTSIQMVHEEVLGIVVKRSRVFAGRSTHFIETARSCISCADIIGETPQEAFELWEHYLNGFVLPTLASLREVYLRCIESEDTEDGLED
jgi:hypothetical protein